MKLVYIVPWLSLGVVFCLPFLMHIFSVTLVSASRYVTVIVNFRKFIRFMFSVQLSIKFYFLVNVSQ